MEKGEREGGGGRGREEGERGRREREGGGRGKEEREGGRREREGGGSTRSEGKDMVTMMTM